MSGWCLKDIDLSLSWHELGWHLEMDWSLFLRDQRPMTTNLNYLVSSAQLTPILEPEMSQGRHCQLPPIRVLSSNHLANQNLGLRLMFSPGIDIMICPPSTGTLFLSMTQIYLDPSKNLMLSTKNYFSYDISFWIKISLQHSPKLTPLLFALTSPTKF